MVTDDLKNIDILDLVNNRWVRHQLNGDILTCNGYPSQKADGTLYLIGGEVESSPRIFKIDPNMIVT